MVWIWVWTMVWRWSDQNAFGQKCLTRDPLCFDQLETTKFLMESCLNSSIESDQSRIKVWAMVWIWVWTMVWRWSVQNAFGQKCLTRDPFCLGSLIRGILGLESLIRVNFRLESLFRDNFGVENLIRQKFGSGPQPGSALSIFKNYTTLIFAKNINLYDNYLKISKRLSTVFLYTT